jgi:hypothetical protein
MNELAKKNQLLILRTYKDYYAFFTYDLSYSLHNTTSILNHDNVIYGIVRVVSIVLQFAVIKQYTVISCLIGKQSRLFFRGSGEDTGNCCPRPLAESSPLPIDNGFDCFPKLGTR